MNIQKLREQIVALQDATMDENRNFRSDYDEGKFDALTAIDNLLDSLQEEPSLSNKHSVDEAMAEIERKAKLFTEANKGKTSEEILAEMRGEEPVSDDFEMALAEMIDNAQTSVVEPLVIAAQWKDELIELAKSEEPVSEDLEEACEQLAENARKHKAETSSPFFSPTDYKQGVIDGTQWQKNHLWKPADGDDLPPIDREVIVLTQPYPLGGNEYVVSFAHRPNQDGWDGKSVITGKTVHYMPKTYDKGGWNIPNIVYWLDVEIPKEIEP